MPRRLLGFLFVFTLLFIIFPPKVCLAKTEITLDFNSQVIVGEEFVININIQGASQNAEYYKKVRIGEENSQLNKGETYGEDSGQWLGDTSSWEKFPKFITDNNGEWVGFIKAKVKSGLSPGKYLLQLRIRRVGTTINEDSSEYELIVSLSSIGSSTPTPTSIPTLIPSPTSTPEIENIYLSEVMPNPEDSKEWVEIYNANNFLVSLKNWQIDDVADGGSSPKTFSAEINANGFYIIETSNVFNNDGDSVRLLDSSGQEKDSMNYNSSKKGISWSKVSGSWCLTNPTKGAANGSCLSDSTLTEESIPTSISSPTPVQLASTSSPTSVLGLAETPQSTVSGEENFSKEIFLGEEGEVMGKKEDISSPASFSQKKFGNNVLPLIFIGLGISMIGVYFWLNKRSKENYSDETEVEEM